MLALLIETSTERGVVAVMRGEEVLFHSDLPFGYQNSQFLLPHIDAGLKKLGLVVRNFDYVAVGIGPGSYTGMRVGAATAKALTFAAQKPLVGVCSLKIFMPHEDGPFAVLIDAKIGGAYMITGHKDNQAIAYLTEPGVFPIEQLPSHLNGIQRLLTPNAKMIKAKLAEQAPELAVTWYECPPDPRHMNSLAKASFDRNEFSRDGQLNLLYLR